MMLPPIEESPVLVLRWTSKALSHHANSNNNLTRHVSQVFERHGLVSLPTKAADILLLTTTQENLEQQAEKSRLIKKRRISREEIIMDYFRVSHREQFRLAKDKNDGRDQFGMFSSHERSHLVQEIVDNISIEGDGDLQKLFSGSTSSNDKNSHLKPPSTSLRYLLERNDFIDVLTPLHNDGLKDIVLKQVCYPLWQRQPPAGRINEYYGPEVGMYFAFVGFLGEWLLPLGVVGLTTFLFRVYRSDTLDEDEYTPFYGLICFLWAILFTIYWERREKELAFEFGTMPLLDRQLSNFSTFGMNEGVGHKRPDFVGELRTSPITGNSELFYPNSSRRVQYIVSAFVTMVMLVVAFWLMILSLNLQGYIAKKENYHPFHYPQLTLLAGEGQLLDATSTWRCFIPVVIHAAGIFVLNTIYRTVATRLTEWENHMTQDAYNNSLVLKRFLFEAFDCYIVLFYLAFYERDVDRL
jgi:anoctamin-10